MAGLGRLKFAADSADLSRKLKFGKIGGTVPMTKIEAFRLAAAEMVDATPEEMSAFIERKFGIVISAPYIPLFQATLRFQKNGSGQESPNEPSCLPNPAQ